MQRRVPALCWLWSDILRCAAAAKLEMDQGALLTTLWGTDYKAKHIH